MRIGMNGIPRKTWDVWIVAGVLTKEGFTGVGLGITES